MYILYKGIDGSVAVGAIADGADVEEVVRKFRAIHPAGFYPNYELMNKAPDLPVNRLFRNAWTASGKRVEIRVDKAKDIHMDRIRAERNKALKELDKEAVINILDQAKLQEIEAKKQALRDIPQTFKLDSLNLENPKMLWPADLTLPEEYKE